MPIQINIPVPEEIQKIAESEDLKLVWIFFVFFSRFEYALKRCPRYLEGSHQEARPRWNLFASDHDHLFKPSSSSELTNSLEYFLRKPPRKQVCKGGRLGWSEPQHHDGKGTLLKWLLRMVRCVRNNLFHGGKFPLIPISDPSHDQELLQNSIVILNACLEFHPDVKNHFFENIED